MLYLKHFIILLVFSANLSAHTDANYSKSNYLNVGGSVTLRSEDMLENGQAYLIPGTLMGGEADAYEVGLSIDDAYLSGGVSWTDRLFLYGELATHQHGQETKVELETLAISYRLLPDYSWFLEGGKFSSRVSPSASWHSNLENYTDAWLQADVHFGRHGNDNGLRLLYKGESWEAGVEAFNGDAFPSSGKQGEFNLYASKDLINESSRFKIGAWIGKAKVKNRFDKRYSSDHSHSGSDVDIPSSEYEFTGDVDSFGTYAVNELNFDLLTVISEIEYLAQTHSGDISRGSQTAEIDYEPETYRVSAGVRKGRHVFKSQWEKLIVENRFENDVDVLFLSESNLQNNNFEPERWTVAWHWSHEVGFVAKIELVNEKLIEQDESQNRINLGLSGNLDLLKYLRNL